MNFYRKKDSELVTASADFSALLGTDYADYGLVLAQATSYATVNTAFATAYGIASNPATRTRAAIEGRNQARKNLVAVARQLADYIIGNPAVSNEQLIELGLDPRTERVPGPVPDAAPGIHIKSLSGRDVFLRLDDTSGTSRGKPPGVAGASLFSHVGPTAPADLSGWKFEGNTGRVQVKISFDESVSAGSLVWFTAFWFNNRKQSGPATAPVSVNIGGGGVSMAA